MSEKKQANASLTPKQEMLITALLQGLSTVDAAKACKINESTAHRWLKLAEVQHFYDVTRKRMLNHSLTGLQLKFDKAVQTLDRHLEARSTSARDQVEAAKTVIGTTIQTAQLVERIAELETQLAEQEQERMYKVIFDLRELTKQEREQLEAIHGSVNARKAGTE